MRKKRRRLGATTLNRRRSIRGSGIRPKWKILLRRGDDRTWTMRIHAVTGKKRIMLGDVRGEFERTSPGILSRPRRIASTLLPKGYVPGLCLRLKNSFMNFSCFYIALIPLPFDSTAAVLSPSPRFLFVANGLWGRSTSPGEEEFSAWSADEEEKTRRGGRLGDPRMPAVKIIRRGGWIIVSNLVASLNCSSNFEIHFEFPIEFIDRIKSLFSHLGSIFDSLNHTLRWYDRVMIIYSIYILGFESLIQDGAAV